MDPFALPERYRAARRDPTLAVLEGLHALKHALRFGAEIIDVRTPDSEALDGLARELAPDVADRVTALATLIDPVLFRALAPSPHPTGVLALARRPPVDLDAVLRDPARAPVVALERPTHHGNIGAAVRVAAAAGAAAVITTGDHDPWHPASLRGGAGLQFALPVTDVPDLMAVAEASRSSDGAGRPLVVVDPDGDPEAVLPPRSILVFGSERAGVSDAVRARADAALAIPMRRGVSSLNLATAVAVILYTRGGSIASSG